MSNFNDGLVADSLGAIVVVQWVTSPIFKLKHLPIGTIGVVWDRKALNAFGPKLIHPIPQILGVDAVKPRKGLSRQRIRSLKDHVTMKVAHVRA